MEISTELKSVIISFQENEITESAIYRRLSQKIRNKSNAKILEQISADEARHYKIWKSYTGEDVKVNKWKFFKFYILSRLLGLTFGLKLMERGENGAQKTYGSMNLIPEAATIMDEEHMHEQQLIGMIDEEHLSYMGSVVLGLNDALVELTGVLAGLTLALGDPKLIALTGTVTGIAAALSMASSEYLSTKSEETDKSAGKASFYTGLAYIFTVVILIMPFLLLSNIYLSLGITFALAIGIIAGFNYYIAVVREIKFKKRFLEMAGISFGVAAISFGIGLLMRQLFGLNI